MSNRPSLLARAAAAFVTSTVALAGAVVLTAAPAQARLTETDFGFQTATYGTRVMADQVGLRSARTAYSHIACTRLAGIDRDVHQDNLGSVNANDMIAVSGIESRNHTFRNQRLGVVGVQGVNTIASIDLGPEGGPTLSFEGLTTRARAWHGEQGFRTATTFTFADVALQVTEQPETGTPLDDLLGAIDQGKKQLVLQVLENAGQIEIPGLGVVRLGHETSRVRRHHASASAFGLRVELYGADTVAGGGDDSVLNLGRAWARVSRNVPAGVFQGLGYAAQVDLVDGLVKAGRLATQPMPCEGTRGKVRESSLAGVNLGGADAVRLGSLAAYSYGEQRKDGSARGWTMGTVANITLGSGDTQLVIDGIAGKATVRQSKSGRVFKNAKGTTIGSITVGGEKQSLPDPGEALEVPGLALVETRLVNRTTRGIAVTAVKITLLTDTPGKSVIKLGNATAKIQRN